MGENALDGGAADAAPTIEGPIYAADDALRLPAEAARSVAPRWLYSFPCGGPCAAYPQVELAPDGGVWGALIGGPGLASYSKMPFVNLSADGQTIAEYSYDLTAYEQSSPLYVDDALQPYALRWTSTFGDTRGSGQVYRVEEGELKAFDLPLAVLQSDTSYLYMESDGSFVEVSHQNNTHAARFDGAGKPLWRQDELRDSPGDSGFTPAVAGLLPLSDGSLFLTGLSKREGDASPSMPSWGLGFESASVLAPDGSLKWDIVFYPSLGLPHYRQVAAGLDGGVVVASVLAVESDLNVVSYDSAGAIKAEWLLQRSGYHSVAPLAVGVDPAGDIYPVIITGERDAARLTICRLVATSPSTQSVCLAVALEAPDSSRDAPPWTDGDVDIALPAKGVAIIAARHGKGDDARHSLVRVDFAP